MYAGRRFGMTVGGMAMAEALIEERVVTATNLKQTEAEADELEAYRQLVSAAMTAATVPQSQPRTAVPPRDVIFNRSPEHAAVVVEHLFAAAQNEVNILSNCLDEKVYNSPNVLDAAVRFLTRKPNAHINILVERDFEFSQHPWLARIVEAGAGRVKIWVVPDQIKKLYAFNFAVSDGKHYRLEQDRKKFEAFAQFGNEKFGTDLDAIFGDIRQLSARIS
jgi:hypothetical protein